MRSILAKVAVLALVTLGFTTDFAEAKKVKQLIQHAADDDIQASMTPTLLAEVESGDALASSAEQPPSDTLPRRLSLKPFMVLAPAPSTGGG